ncbi:SMEK domain-containing protein [Microcoleus sp. ZQ-A2]
MSRTDINRVAQTILIPLLAEVYGYTELKNLDSPEYPNHPAIDLGDETARVSFQVTSTSDTKKVKHTLSKFVENKFYEKYEQLIIYILTKKQDSYSGSGYEEIIQGKFTFDKDKDIWDYRDILREVTNFHCVDKVRRVESILEAHFGEGRTLTEWEVVDKVEQLINEYTQLFVGRSEEFQKLDEFLRENSSGVILVKAGAGFGKTALLANWVNGSRAKNCFIAYHFFSQRYDVTRSVKSAYRNLLRQLYIYYELSYEEPPNDENQVRERLYSILREHGAREDKPLVIALDGLDEAERPFSPPFPTPLPENVFVIASGRAEEGEEPEYLRGWIDSAESICLNRLCRGAIAQWLRNTDELAAFAEDTHFVAQLDEITQGFPLYLRYLTEELSHAAKQGQDVRELLAQTPKGFERYVEQQLRGLDELELPDERWQFFALLAVAKGALEKEDVKALTGMRDRQLRQLHQCWQVTRWMRITETKLYAFAHPLLATTFAEKLEDDAKDAKDALIEYCAKWQKHQSCYALRHYAEYLSEAKRWEELYAIARNKDFTATQREHLPDEPDLPLKTVRTALMGGAETDDAGKMAEFCLTHAWQLIEITQESPLDALRERNLERAWKLADLYDNERRFLWYWLLGWELKDTGRLQDARRVLERLQQKDLNRLPSWQESWRLYYAVYLSRQVRKIDEGSFSALHQYLDQIAAIADEQRDVFHIFSTPKVLYENKTAAELLAKKLEILQYIDNPSWLTRDLIAIATAQVNLGQQEAARDTFDAAIETTQQIDDELLRALIIPEIAIAQAQAGELTAAWKTTQEIYIPTERAKALAALAIAQAKAGNTQRETALATLAVALETAQQEENEHNRATALQALAEAQIQMGKFGDAFETIGQIVNTDQGKAALLSMSIAQAKEGQKQAARTTLANALKDQLQINSFLEQAKALVVIATVQAQVGKYEATHKTLTSALETVNGIDDAWERAEGLKAIYKLQMETTNLADARETAQRIENAHNRTEALRKIAVAQLQAEQKEAAQETLTFALEAGQQIFNQIQRTEALAAIAAVQASAGDRKIAQAIFSDALETAQQIDESWLRAGELGKIAVAQASAGDRETAQAIFRDALELARSDSASEGAFLAIAEAQAQAGDFDAAMETAQQISHQGFYDDALTAIAKAQVQAGEFDAAIEVVRQINYPPDEAKVLSSIAVALAKAGQTEAAQVNFTAALEAVQRMSPCWEQVAELEAIALSLASLGFKQMAMQTVETFLANPKGYLCDFAEVFVETGQKTNFKRLLIERSNRLKSAYRMCGLLARLYPQKAEEIAKMVSEFR